MSKQYELVGAKTYGTVTKIFRAGITYSEEEVGEAVNDANDSGDLYFEEVGAEIKEVEHKKGVVIVGGKKKGESKKAEEPGQQAGSTDEAQGDKGDSTVVTV